MANRTAITPEVIDYYALDDLTFTITRSPEFDTLVPGGAAAPDPGSFDGRSVNRWRCDGPTVLDQSFRDIELRHASIRA